MPKLIAKTPLEGRKLTLGPLTLAETPVGPVTSIAVFPGRAEAVAQGLHSLGLAMPTPNRVVEANGARIVWTGRDQAFLIGVTPPALDGAAVTDQTDGWATLTLWGAGAEDVLARLLPLDMRPLAFPVGETRRTRLNHMNAIVLRLDGTKFQILVFRSMARTAWDELESTMHMVLARSGRKI